MRNGWGGAGGKLGSNPSLATMSKPILLSLDADFWSFEDPMWDWTHSERLAMEWLWQIRFQSCLAVGTDLVHETRLERADFHPLKTISVLRETGWQFSKHCQVTVSDSHMYAFPAFGSLTNARIVNFDAHHDLGYADRRTMQKRWKSEQLQCEDWLWFLLKRRVRMDAVTVFPTWKPDGDLPSHPHWKGTSIEKRVQFRMYSEDVLRELAGEVTHIHIARSGSWLPPWHDSIIPGMVLGMKDELNPQRIAVYGESDPMECRDFDFKQAREHAQLQRDLLKVYGNLRQRHVASP